MGYVADGSPGRLRIGVGDVPIVTLPNPIGAPYGVAELTGNMNQ